MSIKVIIENCRLSYPALFKPREAQDGGTPKYQATILIPKTDAKAVQSVQAAIQQEISQAMQPSGAWKGAQPPNPQLPLYDGDQVQPKSGKPWGDECKGHWVLRTNSTTAPDVVDEYGNKAMDATKFYAGCYCHFSVNIKAFNNKSLGIGAYLNCVMFASEGEPLEAHASAKDDFAGLIANAQQAPQPVASATPGFPYVAQQGASSVAPAQPPVAPQPQAQMPSGFGGFGGFAPQQ